MYQFGWSVANGWRFSFRWATRFFAINFDLFIRLYRRVNTWSAQTSTFWPRTPCVSSCTYCVCHHTVWQPLGFTFLVFSLVARDACATCLDQLTHQPSHLPAVSTMNCRAVCCHFCPGLLLFNWQWLMAMRQGRAEQKRSKKVCTEFWTTQNGTSSHRWHFFLPVTQKHFFASCRHSTLEGD